MSAQVITGAKSSHGDMWNVASSCSSISLVSIESVMSVVKPITANTISAIVSEGKVVTIKYFTCENKLTPTVDDARIVVSESGEILSPK